MPPVLDVTLPFFALVLCGYLAARQRLLPESAVPGLNAYVLFFALPCLLFRFGASMPFAQLLDLRLVGIYAVCALLVIGLAFGATSRRLSRPDAAFGALVAAFPNSGFMGVPLITALLGDAAAGPVIGTLLVDLLMSSTLCLALAQTQTQPRTVRSTGRSTAVMPGLWRALRGAGSNPLPWAIAAGAGAAALGVQPPGPSAQVVKLLADSATPVALFTIGAVLWRAGRHTHTRTPVSGYLPIALAKLLLHPLLVMGLAWAMRHAGIDVPASGVTALALAAALPSASNVSLLAERHGADNGRIARIIMASTVMASVSVPMWAWCLA